MLFVVVNKNIKKIIKFFINPNYRWIILANRGFYNSMSDETFLKKRFKIEMGKNLDLKNPATFNEKLQWLKLNDRIPKYTTMVDKYEVRKLISEKIGEEYLIPLVGAWNKPDEIEFDKLPNQFVLKCNHNSGLGMTICKDKSNLNIRKVKNNLKKGLNQDYYLTSREWPYKNVNRKIICEEYLEDKESPSDLKDYKLMCFDGKVMCTFVCTDRANNKGLKVTFFDNNWNVLPFERKYPKSAEPIVKPKNFEKMIELAEILSKGIPFVRVDFYEVNDKIYFGELTLYPGSGFERFSPESADYMIGDLIRLNIDKM